MTASMKIKGLLAGAATFALIGTAMAQGTPPDKSKSAPVGAGQQSTQGTPMGTTGTPGGAPAMKPSMNSGTAAAPSSSMPSSSMTTSSGGNAAGSAMSSDTSMASNTGGRNMKQRRARADRN
jgi:hypothetical protein